LAVVHGIVHDITYNNSHGFIATHTNPYCKGTQSFAGALTSAGKSAYETPYCSYHIITATPTAAMANNRFESDQAELDWRPDINDDDTATPATSPRLTGTFPVSTFHRHHFSIDTIFRVGRETPAI
jgi:hypothetical protein